MDKKLVPKYFKSYNILFHTFQAYRCINNNDNNNNNNNNNNNKIIKNFYSALSRCDKKCFTKISHKIKMLKLVNCNNTKDNFLWGPEKVNFKFHRN